MPPSKGPSRSELLALEGSTLPDLGGPGAVVVFCGINPGLYTAWAQAHFARPGNRFWPTLHRSGFTARLLAPQEQHLLPRHGLGITNVVARATATAAELSPAELRAGGELLRDKVRTWQPAFLAVLGVTAYREAFGARRAVIGLQQEVLGRTRIWVLPNPSGLNAHYGLPALAALFAELRAAAGVGRPEA
ncbi:G/U mismatch-specific uracil-DNA glycosylase [Motilibacter rhizosphaerae]|uniref:G/U mismatch-specific uracil-DNA glycosylase n=1 Tax=Motilibacter rhizosphaerae TaxID=598652 RepID=A0A4Q7NRC3_9ACTN|nr:G/U mismatch-specific DNA glycosylase [Motilibacter rhizosphaerae]RZS89607.1 G/U mismatch-specific uracil-DNA glycosylase [Motilibacter rhizosphaerae]